MHGMICDYCRKAHESGIGWLVLGVMTAMRYPIETDEAFAARVGPQPEHPLKGTAHLCSDECLRGFVTNGYRPLSDVMA